MRSLGEHAVSARFWPLTERCRTALLTGKPISSVVLFDKHSTLDGSAIIQAVLPFGGMVRFELLIPEETEYVPHGAGFVLKAGDAVLGRGKVGGSL